MNTQLRKNAKNNFGKEFFKFIKNAVFGKTMVRKHRDIKFVPTDGRKNYLVTKSNYQTKKMFQYNLLGVEMKWTQNKTVYLGLSLLKISKIVMYEFWYDYVQPKYGEKPKLCYLGTKNPIVFIKIEEIYIDDVETKFDTWIYKLERPLSKGKSMEK